MKKLVYDLESFNPLIQVNDFYLDKHGNVVTLYTGFNPLIQVNDFYVLLFHCV